MSDLAERLRAGDEAAFEEFREQFATDFYYYFRQHGLPQGEAMDLAETCLQEIPLKVRDHFREGHPNFVGWVRKLRNNAANDWWRRMGGKRFEELDPAMAVPVVEETSTSTASAAMAEALTGLDELDRKLLSLRYDGQTQPTFADMARDLSLWRGEEIREAAVRQRHGRALDKLYRALHADPRVTAFVERFGKALRAARS